MGFRVTRRAVLIGAGAAVLLAATFGAGAWAGAAWAGRFFGSQALPRASTNAMLQLNKLVHLDKGDIDRLRMEIDMQLDGELLAMCAMVNESSSGSRDDVTWARALLQRVARYRAGRPAIYPAEYLAQAGEGPRRKLQECLDAALGSPGK